jgi:hypothetical protein
MFLRRRAVPSRPAVPVLHRVRAADWRSLRAEALELQVAEESVVRAAVAEHDLVGKSGGAAGPPAGMLENTGRRKAVGTDTGEGGEGLTSARNHLGWIPLPSTTA